MRIYAKSCNNKYRVPKIKKMVHDVVYMHQDCRNKDTK